MIGQVGPTDRCYSMPVDEKPNSISQQVEPVRPVSLQERAEIPIQIISDQK